MPSAHQRDTTTGLFLPGSSPNHIKRLRRILTALHAATRVEDMALTGYYLHPLRGDLQGFWSVRVSGNWRVIFHFQDGDAYDVD